MRIQDYQRIAEIELQLREVAAPGVEPMADADRAALVDELTALRARIGIAVVITSKQKYNAIAAKIPDVTQEELDGLRNWENASAVAAPAPEAFALPGGAPVPSTIRSRAHVRDLFTFAEKCALESSDDAGVAVFIGDLAARDTIDLQHPRFAEALDYLVSRGLLTKARKAAVIADEQV